MPDVASGTNAHVEVLIVEDSPTQAAMLRHVLEQEGYAVACASDGMDALVAARRRRPALIISDVVMPRMDGFALCRTLKTDPALRDVPIILATTLADPHDVIRGLEVGADFFLRKPYDDEYLISRVEYVLKNLELRRNTEDAPKRSLRITLDGNTHVIEAEPRQMLDMLISTYEQAVQLNNDLEARERALREAKERADAENRAKSVFLAVMSHEIRTPLSGVLGMLELLSLTRLDAEQRATLDVVLESGKSLQHIINDILDFSKIEAGHMEIRPEPASLSEVVATVHDVYSGSASGKALALTCSVDPRISAALHVDALRLRQVLNNLVSNALKFTPRGGVEIKAELVGRRDQLEEVRFTVRDTGVGISLEAQARLFQPFVQADEDATRAGSGTGLGLTICKRLVELMGGTIELESELGNGTTFAFTLALPCADPAHLRTAERRDRGSVVSTIASRRRAPTADEARSEGTLVLIVDDHPTNRDLLCRQVAVLGYAAESAATGAEALEKWKSGRFAIVITDCNMPGMDGYELTRAIRQVEADEGRTRTLVAACTANALADAPEACFAAGMDDYLSKPVALAELVKKLDEWLPLPARAPSGSRRAQPSQRASEDPASGAAIDPSVLAPISGGDAAVERQILEDFRRANDEDAAGLREAAATRDLVSVTRFSHRMKGASRMVGAHGLAALCERIERAGGAAQWEEIATSVAALPRELARVNAQIDVPCGENLPMRS